MVERFNGRISDILNTHHFHSGDELEQTLHRYVVLYNCPVPCDYLPKRSYPLFRAREVLAYLAQGRNRFWC